MALHTIPDVFMAPDVLAANILCIDKLIRNVRLAYSPYFHRMLYWTHAVPAGTWRSAWLGWLPTPLSSPSPNSQEISRRTIFDAAAKS